MTLLEKATRFDYYNRSNLILQHSPLRNARQVKIIRQALFMYITLWIFCKIIWNLVNKASDAIFILKITIFKAF